MRSPQHDIGNGETQGPPRIGSGEILQSGIHA
jgi:hypothetical protein